MRNVEAHLLGEKIDDAVTHYINSHQASAETVHIDGNLSLNVQDDGGGRVVTVMHSQNYSQQGSRQISIGEQIGDGPWVEELLDGRLAALVAHLAQPSRTSHQQISNSHHKIATTVRNDVDTSVILDGSMRLFNGHSLEQHQELSVQVSDLPLPPLQDMKRCSDNSWFNKDKNTLKEHSAMLPEDNHMLELPSSSPAQNKQSKKSLPHKKRISKKLKRNTGNTTPSQQDIVMIPCEEVQQEQEEILPDSFVEALPRHADPPHLTHVTHIRPVFVCQLCGQFYGEEQLKFYHHLRSHYESSTIIMENPVPDIGIDKMTNTCIVDNSVPLPDSIVELSLENTVPKTMYQPIDKHILYDKQLYKYTMGMDKEVEGELDDTLDKLELYCCVKCNKSFRKQKLCEAHIREVHSSKIEDMGEFSEPEDLMEGIHVADVPEHEGEPEPAEQQEYETVLPHLTVDSGHVHQNHVRSHWYSRECDAQCEAGTNAAANASAGAEAGAESAVCGCAGACEVCAPHYALRDHREHIDLPIKEVLQNILEHDVQPEPDPPPSPKKKKKRDEGKKFECVQCDRVFKHRNSMLYHLLKHSDRKFICPECDKAFYTATSLKIHVRTHNGAKPCRCDECGQHFRRTGDLKYHKASKHSGEKPFKCEYCGKVFARRYSLTLHERIHTGERNYKCDHCPKTFRAASYRQIHMRSHTGAKPYQCTQCEKSFRVAYDLRRHVRIVHEKNNDDPSKKPKDKNTKKDDETNKEKEDKRKPVKKPPNVTVMNKDMKLNDLELIDNKRKSYYKEYDEKPNIKIENDFKFRTQTEDKIEYKSNTDGKMPIFSHIERNNSNLVTLSDIRNIEINRDRELNGDIDMFEKLAFYN